MDANEHCVPAASALVACAPVRRAPIAHGLADIARQASPSRSVRAAAEVHARLLAATGRGLPIEDRTAERWTRATLDRAGAEALASVQEALLCAAAPGRCARDDRRPSSNARATATGAPAAEDPLDDVATAMSTHRRPTTTPSAMPTASSTSAPRVTAGLRPRLRAEDTALVPSWTGWATLHARHGARLTLVAGGDAARESSPAVRVNLHLPIGTHAWLGAALIPTLTATDDTRWALHAGRRLAVGGTVVGRVDDASPRRGDEVWTLVYQR